jgi:aspartate/methionine/tyrosine aminotransferase
MKMDLRMTLNMLGIGTVPLITTAKDGFRPSPELAATLVTPKTKAIALVTPNNPVCHFLLIKSSRS